MTLASSSEKATLLTHPPPRTHTAPASALGSLPPGKSKEAGEAAACVTGMKGTLKLNSVAEEEKSKLVPEEEADAPPPLAFLSAMAANPRPLRGSASPVPHTDRKPITEDATALPHLRTGSTGQRLKDWFASGS